MRIWQNAPLKDMSMEKVRVEEFGESNDEDCRWVNLVFLLGFSLNILSRNSLHFMGIRVFIVGYVRNGKSHFFAKQGILATHLWVGWVASLSLELTTKLDCNFCSVVLLLSWPFNFLHVSHVWHFGKLPVASHSRDLVASPMHTHLRFFTLSHTTLT